MNYSPHRALNIEDLRLMAKRRLTKALFEFCDRGSEDEVAMRNNRSALDNIKLIPRILNDVSDRNTEINLFGKKQSLPLIIGPTGPAGFVWYRGEIALAKAADKAGIPFTLSSTGNTPMETIKTLGGGTQWYQLYVWRDIDAAMVTVKRALDAGFEALLLTVDSPTYNNREFDTRNGVVFPPRITIRGSIDGLLHPRWLIGTLGRYVSADAHMPKFPNVYIPESYSSTDKNNFLVRNDTLSWDFLKRLREAWPRTLIVKGILHPEDATRCADCGVDGIIVSNHAGNTNDAAIAPIQVLPAIVSAVSDRLTVIVDSGFRRGSDVIKGLAMGADAVAIGRATLYGVGAAGEAGASRALSILSAEVHRTMGVMGLTDLNSLVRDHIVLPSKLYSSDRL